MRQVRRFLAPIVLPMLCSPALLSADCNLNGTDDAAEIAAGTARDCNGNGVPDDCDLAPSGLGFLSGGKLLLPYPNDPGPLTLADLDEDGALDVIAVHPGQPEDPNGTISFHRNRGDGTFDPPQVFPVGKKPSYAAAADVDGDGHLDVLVSNEGSGAITLLFHGKGAVLEATRTLRTVGAPRYLSVRDFDGDRDLDLVVITNLDSSPLLLLYPNPGDGAFNLPRSSYSVGPGEIDAGDLDEDGDVDVVAFREGKATLVRNAGDARLFYPLTLFDTPGSYSILALDLNGDGHLDVAAGRHSVLSSINQGKATFARPAVTPGDGRLIAGDFDGDGDLDLLPVGSIELGSGTDLLLNDGSGSFPIRLPLGFEIAKFFPAAADLDGDRTVDLALADVEGLSIARNRGDGTLAADREPVAPYFTDAIVIDDVDVDAREDAAVGRYRRISILRSDGQGGLSAPDDYRTELGALIAGDFNGDGAPDLAMTTGSQGTVSVLPNLGNGKFGLLLDSSLANPASISGLAAADFDRDGDLDLLSGDQSSSPGFDSTVYLLLNGGKGTFTEGNPIAVGYDEEYFAAADLDADGYPDMAATGVFTNFVTLYWNLRHGTFQRGESLQTGMAPSAPPAIADIDGDGLPDIVVACMGIMPRPAGTQGSSLSVLLNTGASFASWGEYGVGSGPTQVLVKDLNGDGRPDVLVPAPYDAEISLLLGKGGGEFISATPFSFGSEPGAAYAAAIDLRGSGFPDLLVGSGYETPLLILRNRTRPPTSADLDKDGVPDECARTRFHRGDPDASGDSGLTDAVFLLGYLVLSGPEPGCREAADVDNDGKIDVSDPIGLLYYLFLGGPAPATPGPAPAPCGPDPDSAASPGDLGCATYPGC